MRSSKSLSRFEGFKVEFNPYLPRDSHCRPPLPIFAQGDLVLWSVRMRRRWTPSIVPGGKDDGVSVLNDFGKRVIASPILSRSFLLTHAFSLRAELSRELWWQ